MHLASITTPHSELQIPLPLDTPCLLLKYAIFVRSGDVLFKWSSQQYDQHNCHPTILFTHRPPSNAPRECRSATNCCLAIISVLLIIALGETQTSLVWLIASRKTEKSLRARCSNWQTKLLSIPF